MLVAFANGFAIGNIASRRPMLITVIAVQTTPVRMLQISSIDDDTHSSDGRNASATTRYRIPKPTSTHLVRIGISRPPRAARCLLFELALLFRLRNGAETIGPTLRRANPVLQFGHKFVALMQ